MNLMKVNIPQTLSKTSEIERVPKGEFFTNWITNKSVTNAQYSEQNRHITDLRDSPEMWRKVKYLFWKTGITSNVSYINV